MSNQLSLNINLLNDPYLLLHLLVHNEIEKIRGPCKKLTFLRDLFWVLNSVY